MALEQPDLVGLMVDLARWSRDALRLAGTSRAFYCAVHCTTRGPVVGRPLLECSGGEIRWSRGLLNCCGPYDSDDRCIRSLGSAGRLAVLSVARLVRGGSPGRVTLYHLEAPQMELLTELEGLTELVVWGSGGDPANLAWLLTRLPGLRGLVLRLGRVFPPQLAAVVPAGLTDLTIEMERHDVRSLGATKTLSPTRMGAIANALDRLPGLRRLSMPGVTCNDEMRRAVRGLSRLVHVAWDGGTVQLALPPPRRRWKI